jgi:hypothetical protein
MPLPSKSSARLSPSMLFRFLAAAAIILLPLACKSSDKPKPIGDNVELSGIDRLIYQTLRDPPRANAVIALINEAEYDLGQINKVFDKRQKEFSKMAVDHKMTGRELDLYLQQWGAEEEVFQRELIATISEIKRRLSPAEWTRIAPSFLNSVFAQSDRMNSVLRHPATGPAPSPSTAPRTYPAPTAPAYSRPVPPPPPSLPPATTTPTSPYTTSPPTPYTTSPPTPYTPPPTAPYTTSPTLPPVRTSPPPTTLPPPPNFSRELAPLPSSQ